MSAVVSDNSAINFLAAIGQAELLRFEFGKIFIPPAVWRGLHAQPKLSGTAAADSASDFGWLIIQQPKLSKMLNQLFDDSGPGEAEAMALAREIKPAIVLLVETNDHVFTCRLGLTTINTFGILASARKSGRLQTVRPLHYHIMKIFRFRLSCEFYDQPVAGDKAD